MLSVAHLFPHFQTLGGVEAVLKQHHAHDREHGFDSHFVIYFEREVLLVPRVNFLGLNERNSITELRDRFSRAISSPPPDISVFHGPWALNYLNDLDGAKRRLLVLHGKTGDLQKTLARHGHFLDGVICISDEMTTLARTCLPGLAPSRILRVNSPVSSMPLPSKPSEPGAIPVIGYCGRLVREHKRVDRLPLFHQHLVRLNFQHRFEILGDGPELEGLRTQMPPSANCVYHGRKSGDDYWRILGNWDFILFVSDTEGLPIGLIEAMSVGVVPIYPAIGSGGDPYVRAIDPNLLYPPGDCVAAANCLTRFIKCHQGHLPMLRLRARETVQSHLDGSYFRQLGQFYQRLLAEERLSISQGQKLIWPLSRLPFSTLQRLGSIRRFLRFKPVGRPL